MTPFLNCPSCFFPAAEKMTSSIQISFQEDKLCHKAVDWLMNEGANGVEVNFAYDTFSNFTLSWHFIMTL